MVIFSLQMEGTSLFFCTNRESKAQKDIQYPWIPSIGELRAEMVHKRERVVWKNKFSYFRICLGLAVGGWGTEKTD